MARSETCEVLRDGRWKVATIDDFLSASRELVTRCFACGGPVRAHRLASNGMRAHFEHRVAHPGCALGSCFDGTSRPHPDATR
ncbi:hypothetical protein [Pseudooceanicola sp. LIPI14-2-Ac024]|uniref:hypothetical protein n=1 Tax=Pseudooceanicola sp. LIPI14-2-Ac024 TaxID=3344875 RepID=UPI0035CEFC31